jgi:hypothetical protein
LTLSQTSRAEGSRRLTILGLNFGIVGARHAVPAASLAGVALPGLFVTLMFTQLGAASYPGCRAMFNGKRHSCKEEMLRPTSRLDAKNRPKRAETKTLN